MESLRILVIEADSACRDLIRQTFATPASLFFAQNRLEALATLRAETIDLVLLDTTVAGGEGLDLLVSLRAEWDSVKLPVILLAALDDSASAVRGLQLGANDYITKPLDADVLRARVNTQVALHKAASDGTQIITQLKFTQEMQENFSRIVSHNLKGPLTNIRMAQFMLRGILQSNNEANDILDHMDATLNDMIEMVRMFLDAMDAQQLSPQLETLDTHDLFVEVVDQYQLAAERKGIQLAICDQTQLLVADRRLLRQVISNLVSNAIKFSPPGTRTCVWAKPDGTNVRISVVDGGPGIPADERDKLFTMFTKLSTRPTGGESSTGLGLWIVKELTQLQKGVVGFDQPADGGALFWVELPSAIGA